MTTTHPPATRAWRFARLSTPFARALAGRRFFPLWAVVHHVGRRTGRRLSVPVAVRATPEVFVIVLPWGPATNWVRNVLAADGAVLCWRAVDLPVTAPEVVDADRARAYFSGPMWWVVEHVIGADSFLVLHR